MVKKPDSQLGKLYSVYRLEGKPNLDRMYEDLEKLVKEFHPEKVPDKYTLIDYNASTETIYDGYKNVLHYMMLRKIPGLGDEPCVRIEKLTGQVMEKFNVFNGYDLRKKIADRINDIIEKHCGKLREDITYLSK